VIAAVVPITLGGLGSNTAAQSSANHPKRDSIANVKPFRSRKPAAPNVAGRSGQPGATPDQDPVADSLRRAGNGDHEAFGRFYDQTAAVVYGIVLKVIRNPSLAEEVTQEVFVELWRLAPRYDPTLGSPQAWSATIAHRRAVDRVRSEQAARTREERDAQHQAVPHDNVTEEVVIRLDHERVASALGQLTEIQREAVTLAYYGGHTYRHVAKLLDVSEGTVKTRIRDGLVRLRDLMEVNYD